MGYVSREDSEALLRELSLLPGSDVEGFFGPASMSWRLNRESAVFLGAGRAALLQVAHPWVAAALAQHSTLLHDAAARFHSTFRVVYTMIFGTRQQALNAARQLWRRHASVQGEVVRGTSVTVAEHYAANEVAALRWVWATLVESAVLGVEFALGPFSEDERERYYAESKRAAALFGIPESALPADWGGFLRYTAGMLASSALQVDADGCALGQSVLRGAGSAVPVPAWYRALTAQWLPPQLQNAFGLAFDPKERARVVRAQRWIARVYPGLPEGVRYVGPYLEAQSRLRGRMPGPWIRASNRFWTGVESVASATS